MSKKKTVVDGQAHRTAAIGHYADLATFRKQTPAERLETLALFLESPLLEDKQWDYSRWVGKGWQGGQNLECGTTACAAGWAAVLWPHTLCIDRRCGRTAVYLQQDSRDDVMLDITTALGIPRQLANVIFIPLEDRGDRDEQEACGVLFDDGPKYNATRFEVAAWIREVLHRYNM